MSPEDPAFPEHLVNRDPPVCPLSGCSASVSPRHNLPCVPLCSVIVPVLTTVSAPQGPGTPALLRAAYPVPGVDAGHTLAVCLGE